MDHLYDHLFYLIDQDASEIVGINIEHYIIVHKIERVKELFVYDELSVKEISYKLHYSSAKGSKTNVFHI